VLPSLAVWPWIQILLLDEITSALDPESTNDVLRLLEELAGNGTTMILVTHELMFARRVADRVAFMHEGQIVEIGQANQVLDDPSTAEVQLFMQSARNSASRAPDWSVDRDATALEPAGIRPAYSRKRQMT
jgi:polar amino acid transport system ATP-binding protein